MDIEIPIGIHRSLLSRKNSTRVQIKAAEIFVRNPDASLAIHNDNMPDAMKAKKLKGFLRNSLLY